MNTSGLVASIPKSEARFVRQGLSKAHNQRPPPSITMEAQREAAVRLEDLLKLGESGQRYYKITDRMKTHLTTPSAGYWGRSTQNCRLKTGITGDFPRILFLWSTSQEEIFL
jgi:hypothetical protein